MINLNVVYPNLAAEIAKRGIKKSAIASALGISGKALYNKMAGIAPFTWPETCTIQHTFFPDIDKDALFISVTDKITAD